MREIKFRCWDKEEKILLYLNFNEISKEADCGMKMASHRFGYQVWLNFILPTHNMNGKYQEDPYINLDSLIWMEFTGLKDKSGKEIYESDIVKCFEYGEDEINIVVGDLIEFHLLLNDDKRGFFVGTKEIIGNIYENADLLKEI